MVSPAIRPGILRRYASCAAKKPNDGPPKSSRLPSGCPSPDGDVDAEVAGRAQHGERVRVALDDHERAGLARGGHERLEVLDRAEEVRVLQEDGADVVAERRVQRGGVGDAVRQRDLLDRASPTPRSSRRAPGASAGAAPRETRKRPRRLIWNASQPAEATAEGAS